MSREEGWYADEGLPGHERYWDGRQWTSSVRPIRAEPRLQAPLRFWAALAYVTMRNAGFAYLGPSKYAAEFESPVGLRERATAAEAHWPRLALLIVTAWHTRRHLGSTSDFVRRHATAAINFQATVLGVWFLLVAGLVAALVWGQRGSAWVFIYVVAMCIAGLYTNGLMCQGAVHALAGKEWRYPFSIRFFR